MDVSSLTGAAASFYDYGTHNGTLSSTPQVGDAVVFGYTASSDWAQHVALVTSVDTAHHTIISVGGNEGSSPGAVHEDGPYDWTLGYSSYMGMTISGYSAPVGLTNTTAVGGTRATSQTASQPDGTIDTFFKGTNGALEHEYYINATWHGPVEFAGTAPMASEPSVVASSPGVVDVFWKGTDGNLWHVFYQPSTGWSTAKNLGFGPLGGAPKAVAEPNGTIGVFWVGNGGTNIWDAWYTPGSGWSGPRQLTTGLYPLYAPAPVNSRPGTWDVFWKGADGNLWHVFSNNNGSSWTTQKFSNSGTLGAEPFATGQSNGIVDVFWKGSDSHLWHMFYLPGSPWNGPQDMGGSVA